MGATSGSAHESVLSRHVLAGSPSRVRAQTSPWACQLSDCFFSGGLRASSWGGGVWPIRFAVVRWFCQSHAR